MGKAIICILPECMRADEILADCDSAGFERQNVLIVRKSASVDAGTAGVLCGALSWLIGLGTFAIPSLEPLIVAGPLMAALRGAVGNETTGGPNEARGQGHCGVQKERERRDRWQRSETRRGRRSRSRSAREARLRVCSDRKKPRPRAKKRYVDD